MSKPFKKTKVNIPKFESTLSYNISGIIESKEKLEFETIKDCKPIDFPYEYYGKLQNVYSGKYFPSNNSRRNCSGFFGYDIVPRLKQNKLFIGYLYKIMFMEFQTEFFLIQFNGYNPNKRIWITVKLILEQAPNGLTHTEYRICSLNILQEINLLYNFNFQSENITFLVVNTLITIYTFYSIYIIIKNLLHNYKIYLQSFWNVLFITKICTFLIAIIIRILFYFTIFDTISVDKTDSFIDTDIICECYELLLFIEAIMACLTLIYFLNFVDKSIIDQISKTIKDSIKNIFIYLVSFLFFVMGFAFFAYFTYGTRSLSNFFK